MIICRFVALRKWRLSAPRSVSLLGVVAIIWWLSAGVRGEEPKPGDEEIKTVQINGQTVTVRFRYCPKGQMIGGDPDKPSRQDTRGFYVSETEISQSQFAAVLGHSRLEQVKARLTALDPNAAAAFLVKGAKPIIGTTPEDAMDFCHAIQDALEGPSKSLRVVSYIFRIPTHIEWQYACRASDPANSIGPSKRHFSNWPSDWRNVLIKGQNLGQYITTGEELDIDRFKTFTGTQDEVVELMKTFERQVKQTKTGNERLMSVFNALLEAALQIAPPTGTNRELVDVEAGGQPTGYHNEWNIYRMHDNVSEWVLFIPEQKGLATVWAAIHRGGKERKDALKQLELRVAGGNYLVQDTTWWRFSIWHWQDRREALVNSDNWQQAPGNRVGVRVLMEQVLSPAYFTDIRAFVATERIDSSALTKLEELRNTIPSMDTQTNEDLTRARIDFYRALASYRTGDQAAADRILQEARGELMKDDPFFGKLKLVIASEPAN